MIFFNLVIRLVQMMKQSTDRISICLQSKLENGDFCLVRYYEYGGVWYRNMDFLGQLIR